MEQDEGLSRRAKEAADAAGLERVEVVRGDAGAVTTFVDVLPVDVLMLCGVFGNVTPEDVERTIALVPSLVTPGGFVVWTRVAPSPTFGPRSGAGSSTPGSTRCRSTAIRSPSASG